MKKYQILEHTADLKIRAYGKTVEEVFAHMAEAMFANMVEPKKIIKKQPTKHLFKMQAADLAALLVDFLSQLLTLSDIKDEIYTNYNIQIIDNKLAGDVKGFKVKGFKTEIKAVTYNEIKLENQAGKWVAEVVFDI